MEHRRSRRRLTWSSPGRTRRDLASGEAGDTLLEIIIAIVVIAIGVVALVGALTDSITSSASYRSLATDDTLLKNFAEAIKYDAQLQPVATSTYQNCATSYQAVSEYPSSGVAGSGAITVFGTDFTSGAPVTIDLVSGSAVTPATIITGDRTVESNGTVSSTFTIPAGLSGSQTVELNSVPSATALDVSAIGSATNSPVVGYHVGISSIEYWNSVNDDFDLSCAANDNSGIQMITLNASNSSNVSDTLSFVITAPGAEPGITVSSSTTAGQVTLTATLTGTSGGGYPAGSLAWSLSGSAPPTCGTPLVQVGSSDTSSASCTITTAGTYQVVATYQPAADSQYSSATWYGSATVGAAPTLSITAPSSPSSGTQTLTFGVTITGAVGVAPTNPVSWFSSNPTDMTCTQSNSTWTATGPDTYAAGNITCTVGSNDTGYYQLTVSYPGDDDYLPQTATSASVDVTST